ncbi:MAG TPA: cupin domain-containing protein [Methylomirabilota bacterium]|jgi:quercetin dioxygenase-like cupin family protein
MSKQARATVQVDNDRVRVTEWRFGPGEATGWHRHELDYVVVPMTVGPLIIRSGQGEMQNDIAPGQAYFRVAGAEHDVSNPNGREVVFVEIELKPR